MIFEFFLAQSTKDKAEGAAIVTQEQLEQITKGLGGLGNTLINHLLIGWLIFQMTSNVSVGGFLGGKSTDDKTKGKKGKIVCV